MQGLDILFGKVAEFSYRRVLFKYYFSFAVGEYLQGITFTNPKRAAYLLGNDHPPQLIYSANYTCCLQNDFLLCCKVYSQIVFVGMFVLCAFKLRAYGNHETFFQI